jgi:hypothetical protein
VAWSGSGDEYESFVDRYELTFPQIDDSAAEVFTRFGLGSQPAIAFVLPDGEVQTLMGAADEELLDSIISSSI